MPKFKLKNQVRIINATDMQYPIFLHPLVGKVGMITAIQQREYNGPYTYDVRFEPSGYTTWFREDQIEFVRLSDNSIYITVNETDLRQVLVAFMCESSVAVMELKAAMSLPDNPVKKLIDQFNKQVEAYNGTPTQP